MAVIRELFASPEVREGLERDEAIRALSRRLGFERAGSRIREILEGDLSAAARRHIVETVGGRLTLLRRTIAEYERGFLKEQLLSALGQSWVGRDEAAIRLARWLGFRRTGAAIQRVTKSLINGLLRQGRLEADGDMVRRVPGRGGR